MLRLLLKYLKPYLLSVLAVILLLFGQALLDLRLPNYMSDIVNKGIQQNGINDFILTSLSEVEHEKLVLFLDDSQQELFTNSYSLDTNKIYQINSNADKTALANLWRTPLLLSSLIDSQQIDLSLPDNLNAYQYLKSLSAKERIDTVNNWLKLTEDYDETTTRQILVSAITQQNQAAGLIPGTIQRNYIIFTGGKMLLVALFAVLLAVVNSYLSSRLAAGVARTLRKDLFTKVESFSAADFNNFSTASLITRTTNDISQIQGVVTMLFRFVLFSPIMGIGALLNVLNSDVEMVWIIGCGIAFIVILIILVLIFVLPKFKIIQNLIDRVNLIARENLTGLLVIRAFAKEKDEKARFDQANKKLANVQLFVNRTMVLLMPVMNFGMGLLTLLIVGFGAKQVDIGNMQVGDIMAFIQYAMHIIMSFIFIAASFVIIPRAAISANRIMEVIDAPLSVVNPSQPQAFIKEHQGEVTFNNVSFKYPDAEDYSLEDLSFIAKAGETTAVIGSTGSGKTTLINLMLRLYDTTAGEVLVNGVNVKMVNQEDLRAKIGYIPQKAVLFSGSIEENLRYGKEDADDNALDKACAIAQATEIIAEKSDGYQELIAQGGTNVSGGQKQRLSIARALLKEADIFIFDDSLSALDFKTEAALRKALKTELAGKTLIIVTQRVSTVMDANNILVLNDGRIVGNGTHQDLLKTCEVYQEIAYSQLSEKELAYE